MRIICTINNPKQAKFLSDYLKTQGIDNQLETITNQDWGSPNYSDATSRIWVYNEDQVKEAIHLIESIDSHIHINGQLKSGSFLSPTTPPEPEVINPSAILMEGESEHTGNKTHTHILYNQNPFKKGAQGTFYLILICCILFMIDTISEPFVTVIPNYLPTTPLLASPLKKDTLYDYPKAYTIVDELESTYGMKALTQPQFLPDSGKHLIQEFQTTPYWQGIYPQLESPNGIVINAPLFEKIRAGEVWRLITPCFLHNDILHLLFNMLWLFVLGKQIEPRLGVRRYLLLIVLTGAFSCTCQYLMGGANFLGFSGVLCAMLTFIYMRQQIAPEENYPLEKATFKFMMYFIVIMMGIQILSFYLENYHQISISPGIANTAHISGALIGLLLGLLPFFAKQLSQKRSS